MQELIPGPETRIESHHVYIDASVRTGATWLRPREAWRAPRAAGGAPLRWLRFLRDAAANASFDPHDPMPFLRGEAWNGLKRSVAGRG